jgi:hypothetical protein
MISFSGKELALTSGALLNQDDTTQAISEHTA